MAETPNRLEVSLPIPLKCGNAGVYAPREEGKYPARKLEMFELVFVRQGTMYVAEEGRSFTVSPRQTLLLWPGRRHAGWKLNSADLVYYWVYFRLEAAALAPGDSMAAVPQSTTVSRPDHLVALFNRLLDTRDADLGNGLAADLCLGLILCEVGYQPPPKVQPESTAALASRADAIIRSSFQLQLSTASIAEQIGCSPDYLGRTYHKVHGVSVIEAIHRRRIQHARHLLTMGEFSLDDVARLCGFVDAGYFRRVFKRYEGMTPRHYQTLHVRALWEK